MKETSKNRHTKLYTMRHNIERFGDVNNIAQQSLWVTQWRLGKGLAKLLGALLMIVHRRLHIPWFTFIVTFKVILTHYDSTKHGQLFRDSDSVSSDCEHRVCSSNLQNLACAAFGSCRQNLLFTINGFFSPSSSLSLKGMSYGSEILHGVLKSCVATVADGGAKQRVERAQTASSGNFPT